MATREQMERALIGAHNAGDVEAAKILARALKEQDSAPQQQDASLLDRAAAGASGFNSLALANIPGLAVDTALNVADLARAGYGAVGKKLGLLKTEQMPDTLDRSQFVGSSDWIKNKIRDAGGGVFIDNPRPDDAASRVLHTVGNSAAGKGGPAAGLAMGLASEAGLSPEWQIMASMAPQGARTAALAGARRVLAGNDAQRAQMAQNLNTLSDAGVQNPSAGLAGPRQAAAAEALAARYPGSAGVMAENAAGVQSDLANKVRGVAASLSGRRGEADTGIAMQQDITGRWKPEFDALYNRLDSQVTSRVGNGPVGIPNSLAASQDIAAGIPGAPAVSGLLLRGSKVPSLYDALTIDAAAAGPVPPGGGAIPYPALRGVGSMIGKEAGDRALHGSAETGRYKQVYGAIAEDKAAAANAAGAGRELQRANKFYSSGVDKMENLLGNFTKDGMSGEQAYNQFRNMVFSSPSKAHALRKSLSEDVRKMQTATLIDELGQATPGKQNAGGTNFSSETFLTNWNKLSPESKAVIFSGFKDAGVVRSNLEAVAKASELIRSKAGIYANPSGTSGATIQAGVAGGAGAAAISGNIPALAGILGSVASANITARLMTNPKFVSWLAQSKSIVKPEAAQSHIRRLAVISQEMDDQTRADLERFAAALPK